MRVAAVLLAIVSSAFAYQVLSPGGSQGWTNQGAQTCVVMVSASELELNPSPASPGSALRLTDRTSLCCSPTRYVLREKGVSCIC